MHILTCHHSTHCDLSAIHPCPGILWRLGNLSTRCHHYYTSTTRCHYTSTTRYHYTSTTRYCTFTIRYSYTRYYSNTPNYVGVKRVELVMFNCPEWGIEVQNIRLLAGTSASASRSLVGTFSPNITSCDSLVRVCTHVKDLQENRESF